MKLNIMMGLSNLRYFPSYLQVEHIFIRFFKIFVEFSGGGWAYQSSLALMRHAQ
jgi:hypothetical protein